ncbi:MAG: LacI family DNA-binding transcriptional regulator [Enterocloster bolteae]
MSIQKKDKYTISDVAQMLGVSRSTISRAMNNSPGVGEELRKKVLDFVEEIGYQPNTIARSLSKGRTKHHCADCQRHPQSVLCGSYLLHPEDSSQQWIYADGPEQ